MMLIHPVRKDLKDFESLRTASVVALINYARSTQDIIAGLRDPVWTVYICYAPSHTSPHFVIPVNGRVLLHSLSPTKSYVCA